MNKYKAILAGAVLLTVPVVCSAGIVMGDFEGGLDGWYAGNAVLSNDTVGVTLGSQSLKLTDADGGWGPGMEIALLGQANSNALVAAATQPGAAISMDVTIPSGSVPDGWLGIGVLVNAEGYWSSQTLWEYPAQDTTVSLVIPLDAAAQTAIATGAANHSYANIGIMSNGGSGGNAFYIDNIQIIPEPASIGLLAFAGGGVLFFRRRFKK